MLNMLNIYLKTEYGNLYPYSIEQYTHYCNGEEHDEIELVYTKDQEIPDIPTPFLAEYVMGEKTIAMLTISRIRVEESWDAE